MSRFGFGFGAPVMGPMAGFGANNGRVMQSRGRPSYAPGAVQSQSMMMPGQGEDVDELLAMLEAQSRGQNRPPAAMHAQPGPMPPQASAQPMPDQPIKAPSDRGMFGRFLGGLGKFAGKAGEFAMFGPVGMQIRADHRRSQERAEQKAAEEEARRQQMLQQLSGMPGVTDQQRQLLGMGIGVDQFAEQAFAPPEQAEYGLDLVPVRDPETGRTIYVQASKAGGYRPVEGIEPFPETSDENWTKITLEDGEYEYVLGKPDTLRKIGPSPAKTPLVDFGGFGMDYGSIPQAMARVKDPESPTGSRLVSEPGVPSKPLMGADSMGRVAAGLANMRKSVSDLTQLFAGGYRPGQDWVALTLEAVPLPGADVAARLAGGQDYQNFDLAYSTFEASALPILSGAAVVESEAKRALKALRVRIGDSQETIQRKLANMNRMVQGLDAAAAGDTEALQQLISGIIEEDKQGAAPVQEAAGGPPVGTVRNGYRFKGGNPNDSNNWEPVQ